MQENEEELATAGNPAVRLGCGPDPEAGEGACGEVGASIPAALWCQEAPAARPGSPQPSTPCHRSQDQGTGTQGAPARSVTSVPMWGGISEGNSRAPGYVPSSRESVRHVLLA